MLNMHDLVRYLRLPCNFALNERMSKYYFVNFFKYDNYEVMFDLENKVTFIFDNCGKTYIYIGQLKKSEFEELNSSLMIDIVYYQSKRNQFDLPYGTLEFIRKLKSKSCLNKLIILIINKGIKI